MLMPTTEGKLQRRLGNQAGSEKLFLKYSGFGVMFWGSRDTI
jgi:hypothetical protein